MLAGQFGRQAEVGGRQPSPQLQPPRQGLLPQPDGQAGQRRQVAGNHQPGALQIQHPAERAAEIEAGCAAPSLHAGPQESVLAQLAPQPGEQGRGAEAETLGRFGLHQQIEASLAGQPPGDRSCPGLIPPATGGQLQLLVIAAQGQGRQGQVRGVGAGSPADSLGLQEAATAGHPLLQAQPHLAIGVSRQAGGGRQGQQRAEGGEGQAPGREIPLPTLALTPLALAQKQQGAGILGPLQPGAHVDATGRQVEVGLTPDLGLQGPPVGLGEAPKPHLGRLQQPESQVELGGPAARLQGSQFPDLPQAVAAQVDFGADEIQLQLEALLLPAGQGPYPGPNAAHSDGGVIALARQETAGTHLQPPRAKALIGTQLQRVPHDGAHLTFDPGSPVAIEPGQQPIGADPGQQRQSCHRTAGQNQGQQQPSGEAAGRTQALGWRGLRQQGHPP